MTTTSRALAFASSWFNAATVDRVFVPLLADWQRELDATTTRLQRVRVFAAGFAALLLTFIRCSFEGDIIMPRGTLSRGLLVLTISTIVLLTLQMISMTLTSQRFIPLEMRFWASLPPAAAIALPLAILPFMMVARGLGHITIRGAWALVAAAAVAAYVTAGLTPLLRGDFRDDLYERIHQQQVANDRAGLFTYPGTARRQARPTTPEQRAAAREQWRQSPFYQASQAAQTRPRWGRAAVVPAALTLALGAMGWALGGLGRTRAIQAIGWWALACIVLLFDGRFLYPGTQVSAIIPRAPFWLPAALFGAAAIALLSFSTLKREQGRASR